MQLGGRSVQHHAQTDTVFLQPVHDPGRAFAADYRLPAFVPGTPSLWDTASGISSHTVTPAMVPAAKERIKGKKLVVTIEDNITDGGMGQYVSARADICIPTLHLGFESCFVPHGKQEELFEICKLDSKSIADRILSFYKGMGM